MRDLQRDISLSDLFNISASAYKDVMIEELPLTVRQYNGLLGAGCRSLENLLNLTIDDLFNIRNLGKGSIDGIIDYVTKLDVDKRTPKKKDSQIIDVSAFREYKNLILTGRFEDIKDESLDKSILERYKKAFEETESELVELCINDPEKAIPLIEGICSWSMKLGCVAEALKRIPTYRLKNQAIGYINAYININRSWDFKLSDDFDYGKTLESFIWGLDSNQLDNLTGFLDWCAKDIREITESFVAEIAKKDRDLQVVELRKEKKTLEEVGSFFGVTRERIRQIEAKTKRKASVWAKNNKILRLMSADLNSKTIMTPKDFERLLGHNGGLVFYLLTDSEEAKIEGFVYDKAYKVFVFGDDLDFLAEEEYVEKLPVIIPKDEYETTIQAALESENGISEDQLRMVLDNEYQLQDGFYRSKHEKLSLTTMYGEVLKKHFSKGIRVHLDADLELFKKYVFEDYGLDISQKSNRSVDSIIARIGILCDRGTVCPKRDVYISDELKEKIRRYILEKKNPLIFVNSIFSIFEEELKNFGIDNRYYLQGVLKEEFSSEFYITRDYISREPITDTIYTSVVDYIKKYSYPISKEDIFREFPGLSEIMLNFSTINDPGVINYFGQYMHIDRLKLFDFDKEYLNDTVQKLLSDGKPHHDEELYDFISSDNPDLLKRIYVTFPYSLFSFLESYFGEQYQFARPYIAKNEVEIGNPYERIKEYVIGEECVDIDDILGVAKELHFQINSILEFLLSFKDTHILISSEQLATLNYIGIDDQSFHMIEDKIISEVKSTVPIRDISCIQQFKSLNVPWTDWLLYGLIDKFGQRIDVGVSNNQFRLAVPLISPKGALNVDEYSELKGDSFGTIRLADNLDNIDDLIADLIVGEIEGDSDEL